MDADPTADPEASQRPPGDGYQFDRCDECGAELAPDDRLWGLCPQCM